MYRTSIVKTMLVSPRWMLMMMRRKWQSCCMPSGGTRFPFVPSCLVVENAHEFGEQLDRAVKSLESDGLTLNVAKPIVIEPESWCWSSNEVSKTINDTQKVMQKCNHALHKSNVYAKPQEVPPCMWNNSTNTVRPRSHRSASWLLFLHKIAKLHSFTNPCIKPW